MSQCVSVSIRPILLDQTSNTNSELKPLVREEVISHLCCCEWQEEGLGVCKWEGAQRTKGAKETRKKRQRDNNSVHAKTYIQINQMNWIYRPAPKYIHLDYPCLSQRALFMNSAVTIWKTVIAAALLGTWTIHVEALYICIMFQ